MNFFSLGRIVKGLYEDKKELQSALEHMEDELTMEIEALQDENEYLKDELATLRVKDKRLEDEIKTVRERDFKDIYPGLQRENEGLRKDIEALTKDVNYHTCQTCTLEDCEYKVRAGQLKRINCPHYEGEDEVPTETTPENS